MANGPSALITSAPTLIYVSSTDTAVTLNLTAIPASTTHVTIAHKKAGASQWTMETVRTATGSFTISSLTDGAVYDFIAIPQEVAGEIGPASTPLRIALSNSVPAFGLEELLLAIQETAANIVWPGSATKIFNTGATYIVSDEGVVEEELAKARFPAAFIYEIGEEGGIADESPTFAKVRVGLSVVVVAQGDPMGTKALLGGNRASSTVNAGAGIYDVHDAVQKQLTKILRNSTYPVRFLSVMPSSSSTRPMSNGRMLAIKSYTILAIIKELS